MSSVRESETGRERPEDDGPPGAGHGFVETSTSAEDSSQRLSSKSSVLGTELAKKRLQAFCIQKKQINSPTYSKLTPNMSLASPVLFGNKIQGPLKKMSNVLKTLDDNYDKNKYPKKFSKKVSEYEKSRTTLTEIVELKKEEERKLALVKLGIPLGLVPGGTSVKGLTTKPMPTKAMPPIKNFLDPQEVESLLKKVDQLNGEIQNLKFKPSVKDDKKSDNKKANEQKHNKSHYSYNYDRNNRYNGGRYSDNYRRHNDKYDKNDRHRSRRRHDSYSRSSRRRSSETTDTQKNQNLTNDKTDDNKRSSSEKSLHLRRNDNGEKPKSDLNISLNISTPTKSLSLSSKETNTEFDKNETNIKDDGVHDSSAKNVIDMFSFEIDAKNDDDSNEFDKKESSSVVSPTEISQESQIIYDKFLRDKFVPVPEFNDTNTAIDDNETHISSPENVPMDINPAKEKKDLADLYSPGMESSREPTPLTNIQTIKETSCIKNVDKEVNYLNEVVKPKNNIWSDIELTCNPKKHFSQSCFRRTSHRPSLLYCENSNFCECGDIKAKSREKLSAKIDLIMPCISTESDKIDTDFARSWYPKLDKVFNNTVQIESTSNWDTDDSLSQPPNTSTEIYPEIKTKIDFMDIAEPLLNFKNIDVSDDIIQDNTSISKNFKLLDDVSNASVPSQNAEPPATSLDSEYEKFMEAVRPEIGDKGDDSDMTPSITNNLPNLPGKTIALENKKADFQLKLDSVKHTLEKMDDLNFSDIDNFKPNESNICSNFPEEMSQESVINNIHSEIGTEYWSSDNVSDNQKYDKFMNSDRSSPKLTKRKGHAKISSRRHKGKHKSKKNYQSSSTSSSSSSTHSSSESSSSESNSSSSEDSTTTSSVSSSTSSTSSSESSTSSSEESLDSSDDSRSKSKKKQLTSKDKKYKRKKKQLFAKAKRLAKKLRNRKRKKKLKEKLNKDKDKDIEIYNRKEIVNEFSLNNNDEIVNNENDKMKSILESLKGKKRKAKDKKAKVKNKKKKRSSSSESTTSDDDSCSDSDQSKTNQSAKKRYHEDEDANECDIITKKSKNVSTHIENVEKTNDIFNMDTLLNIKREKISDEENSSNKIKAIETNVRPNRSGYRQEIISASELQSSFLEGNKHNESINSIIIKTETLHDNIQPQPNKTVTPPPPPPVSCEKIDKENLDSSFDIEEKNVIPDANVDNLTENEKSTENTQLSPVESTESLNIKSDDKLEASSIIPETEEIKVLPIGRIECDWRPDNVVKPPRERKPSRWGAITTNTEPISCVSNSALIEVSIQNEVDTNVSKSNDSHLHVKPEVDSNQYQNSLNFYENSYHQEHKYKANEENRIYKIQTISSGNVTGIQSYIDSVNSYENFNKQEVVVNEEMTPNEDKPQSSNSKSPVRKISLDDRINMALQFLVGEPEVIEKPPPKDKSPEKGILVTGGSRLTRSDPRIARGKKVSFADGLTPGQDSDCENEPQNSMVTQLPPNECISKKKKRRSCGGHAYPCPETWPDYHPHWDRLPPPPPPPGSPPPELFDKTNISFSINSNSNPLSPLPRMTNVIAS